VKISDGLNMARLGHSTSGRFCIGTDDSRTSLSPLHCVQMNNSRRVIFYAHVLSLKKWVEKARVEF